MNYRSLDKSLLAALCGASCFAGSTCMADGAAPLIKDGDIVAIVGDSITEQKLYSAFMEDYLLMCQPVKVSAIQFGWGGETVGGLNSRIKDVLAFKPTVVTTCYGMNDGGYRPINDDIRRVYRENTEAMIKTFVGSGAKMVVGSPGAVDTATFHPNSPKDAGTYNENLAALTAEAKGEAEKNGQGFADVHDAMMSTMADLKAKYGRDFQVAGGDGVHPGLDGHVIMAYAFLKAMNFDGNIGAYTVDLAAHTATASAGHKLSKFEGNALTIESTQYPFCFFGKPGDINATATTEDFLPFNQDLNRLMLTATGPAASYKVTWGKTSKTYTADQLKSGINLAAEFVDNPFSAPFAAVNNAVQAKQNVETQLIKGPLHSLPGIPGILPDEPTVAPAVNAIISAIVKHETALNEQVRAAVKPVTHTLTIEAAH